jgi:1,6-anhydro-N-acetylmuramate kinase
MHAHMRRHAQCAAYLLEQGADPFAVDRIQRRSTIHYAVAGSHSAVLRLLLSDAAVVHTDDGALPLRDVRVHDMSGQCRRARLFRLPGLAL